MCCVRCAVCTWSNRALIRFGFGFGYRLPIANLNARALNSIYLGLAQLDQIDNNNAHKFIGWLSMDRVSSMTSFAFFRICLSSHLLLLLLLTCLPSCCALSSMCVFVVLAATSNANTISIAWWQTILSKAFAYVILCTNRAIYTCSFIDASDGNNLILIS